MDKIITKTCKIHGETDFVLEVRGYYRCKKCRVLHTGKRRRKVKELLVAENGGKCSICGYDRCMRALEFHHLDRETKSFNVSTSNVVKMAKRREEAEKCILVCSNCHCELEDGIISV